MRRVHWCEAGALVHQVLGCTGAVRELSVITSINSRRNPVVARFRALAREGDPAGSAVILDGAHLVAEARASGLEFDVVAVAASRLAAESEQGRLARSLSADGVHVVQVPDALFDAVSPVRTPSGLTAIVARRSVAATDLCAPGQAFLVAVVDVQDPGNVGALIRTGEACGVTGMFVCGQSASPFGWKSIRGSMGSALRVPLVDGLKTSAVLACLRRSGARAVAAVPHSGVAPDAIDWRGKLAIVLGGEGSGLSTEAIEACDARVSIPMAPGVESLNVAAAGAILMYAAGRQRA
jgi:TrmH family RNA methyltransferase